MNYEVVKKSGLSEGDVGSKRKKGRNPLLKKNDNKAAIIAWEKFKLLAITLIVLQTRTHKSILKLMFGDNLWIRLFKTIRKN